MLVVIDLDGVVYRGKEVVPYAPQTITYLRRQGHRIYFLTNNSALTREGFKRRLLRHGVDCRKEEIMSSGYATVLFLKKKKGVKGNIFVIGGKGLSREMEAAGFRVVKRYIHKIDYVVVGMDRDFRYRDLYTAQQAILKGALFVATNADPTYPVEDGVLPGAGAMVSAIRISTATSPIIIGKPNPFILKEILRETNIPPSNTILIGDRLDSDILLGKRCRVKTVLVLTGITKERELRNVRKDRMPDYVIKDLRYLPKLKEFSRVN